MSIHNSAQPNHIYRCAVGTEAAVAKLAVPAVAPALDAASHRHPTSMRAASSQPDENTECMEEQKRRGAEFSSEVLWSPLPILCVLRALCGELSASGSRLITFDPYRLG
jgi:hypothetical protein